MRSDGVGNRSRPDSVLRGIYGDFQFFGKSIGIEGATCEVAPFDFDGGNLSPAVVDSHHKVLRVGVFIDIDLAEHHAALAEELLGAAAVTAKACAINGDFSHVPLVLAQTAGKR